MKVPATRHREAWLLATLLGGMFLGNVDLAIVNVATPAIGADLRASGAALELVVSGYTLAYAMLLITSARLGEGLGYRRMYRCGLVVFTISSLGCGLAPTAPVLIIARIVQGASAALMAAQVLIGIQVDIDERARGRALGLYAAVLSGSAVVGQVLGGVLVSGNLFGAGWRPIFLINVPIGAALALACVMLPADRPRHRRRLDLAGVATLSSAVLLLVMPLVLGPASGWPAWSLACLAASPAAFAAFVHTERRVLARGGHPLITLPLLRRPPVAFALLAQAATRATYLGLLFVLALYLQHGLGRSAVFSGLALVPWVAAFGVAGPILGRVSPGTKRLAGPIGTIILAAGFAGISMAAATSDGSDALLLGLLGVGGLGYGAAFSGTLAHLTETVTGRYAADVSGLFNTTLQVGGAVGVAVFGTVYLDLASTPTPTAATHAFAITAVALAATALLAAGLAHLAIHQPVRPLAPPAARSPGRDSYPKKPAPSRPATPQARSDLTNSPHPAR